jgi:acyl carrier protein
MQPSQSEIMSRVRAFVQENFLYMRPDFVLADDERLLERGVVDSMGVAEMVSFVEDEFGVSALEEEITESNFGSLRGIASFVVNKRLAAVS